AAAAEVTQAVFLVLARGAHRLRKAVLVVPGYRGRLPSRMCPPSTPAVVVRAGAGYSRRRYGVHHAVEALAGIRSWILNPGCLLGAGKIAYAYPVQEIG